MIEMYSRVRANGLEKGPPYQPSTTWGPETPSPKIIRPLDKWSMVKAAMAMAVGVRADIWQIPVPSLILLVCAPIQAKGVMASLP